MSILRKLNFYFRRPVTKGLMDQFQNNIDIALSNITGSLVGNNVIITGLNIKIDTVGDVTVQPGSGTSPRGEYVINEKEVKLSLSGFIRPILPIITNKIYIELNKVVGRDGVSKDGLGNNTWLNETEKTELTVKDTRNTDALLIAIIELDDKTPFEDLSIIHNDNKSKMFTDLEKSTTDLEKSTTDLEKSTTDLKLSSNPTGCIIAMSVDKVPDGYLACDGARIKRSTYKNLFDVIGTTDGDGNTKNGVAVAQNDPEYDKYFNVPDYRGMFLRGKGGNSLDFGVKQEDAGREISGSISGGLGGFNDTGRPSSSGSLSSLRVSSGGVSNSNKVYPIYGFNFYASRQWGSSHTANEFRPVNHAVKYCIKY